MKTTKSRRPIRAKTKTKAKTMARTQPKAKQASKKPASSAKVSSSKASSGKRPSTQGRSVGVLGRHWSESPESAKKGRYPSQDQAQDQTGNPDKTDESTVDTDISQAA